MNRWLFIWRRTTRELWFRAGLYAVFGVVAALAAVVAAPLVPTAMADRFGGESVEQVLTILASSLLAVATFSLGAMVTAYTAVSSAATPRVASLVTGDEATQKSLATFVGAFLYAIVGVTAINAHYYAAAGRAVLFLISLAVVGLVAFRLLAWINRLSRLARLGHMIELVEDRATRALVEAAARPNLGGRAGSLGPGALVVTSPRTGYVQNVDPDHLQRAAGAADTHVEVIAVPGTFVRRGEALCRLDLTAADGAVQDSFCAAFTLGRSRSFDQDPRFALTVLGEIAGKALSPGVNDPGTAVEIATAGVRLLDAWCQARDEAPEAPEVTHDRLRAAPLPEAEMLDDVFGPLIRYGAGDLRVAIVLQQALGSLGAERGPLGRAAARLGKEALKRSVAAMASAPDRARLRTIIS
ncbi:MAG: putative membrane protein [Brevundimonas sp.]|jgi:uncharacterized membrane protein|uniref:DUF2254 domain-containing protein n=1 Tax=Brevundimonas sp. TaxID=1871086 RepID=UPI002486FECE|nr:DUF2254 domain-containing protein [Brevundimonas sp.]MDI1281048.1 DUF2254 domain-containing protein [Brevundimonas sp.]